MQSVRSFSHFRQYWTLNASLPISVHVQWVVPNLAPFLPKLAPFFYSKFIVQSHTFWLPNLAPFSVPASVIFAVSPFPNNFVGIIYRYIKYGYIFSIYALLTNSFSSSSFFMREFSAQLKTEINIRTSWDELISPRLRQLTWAGVKATEGLQANKLIDLLVT